MYTSIYTFFFCGKDAAWLHPEPKGRILQYALYGNRDGGARFVSERERFHPRTASSRDAVHVG